MRAADLLTPKCRILFEVRHMWLKFEVSPTAANRRTNGQRRISAFPTLLEAMKEAEAEGTEVMWSVYLSAIQHPVTYLRDFRDPADITDYLGTHFGEEVVGTYLRAIEHYHNHELYKPAVREADRLLASTELPTAGDPVVLALASEGTGRSLHGVRPGQEIGGRPGDDAEERGSATLGELRRTFEVLALQDHRARRALQGSPDLWSAITCFLGLTAYYQGALVKRLDELEMIAPRKVRIGDKTYIWNCPVDQVPEEKIDPAAL